VQGGGLGTEIAPSLVRGVADVGNVDLAFADVVASSVQGALVLVSDELLLIYACLFCLTTASAEERGRCYGILAIG
jgi:hypothetical protein